MSGNGLAGLLQAQILHSAISPRNQTALTKRKAELLHADFLDLRHGRLKSEAAVMVLMNQDPLPRPRGPPPSLTDFHSNGHSGGPPGVYIILIWGPSVLRMS
jgi:hypothetical protein